MRTIGFDMYEKSRRFMQSMKHMAFELPARWKRGIITNGLKGERCKASGAPDSPLNALLSAIVALRKARKIVIIPGHGLFLSGAHHKLLCLSEYLRGTGKIVHLAIHPAAGWVPGQLLILLGEADNLLTSVQRINHALASADLALIVGACDVVNPVLSQIEGPDKRTQMVLQVESATDIVVCNQDIGPGLSGVKNILFENPRTIFLPGDAWNMLQTLIASLT